MPLLGQGRLADLTQRLQTPTTQPSIDITGLQERLRQSVPDEPKGYWDGEWHGMEGPDAEDMAWAERQKAAMDKRMASPDFDPLAGQRETRAQIEAVRGYAARTGGRDEAMGRAVEGFRFTEKELLDRVRPLGSEATRAVARLIHEGRRREAEELVEKHSDEIDAALDRAAGDRFFERMHPLVRPIASGLAQSGLSSASLVARPATEIARRVAPGSRLAELSGTLERESAEASQARQRVGGMPDLLGTAVEGATRSLADVFTIGQIIPGGAKAAAGAGRLAKAAGRLNEARGLVAAFSLKASNAAVTEGRKAGLKGGDLARYAATQGAIEGGVMSIFQAVGLGGLEKAALSEGVQSVSGGIRAALKEAGVELVSELTEENITEILQSVNTALSGVDPEAITAERLWETAKQTTATTVLTMGLMKAPSIAAAATTPKPGRELVHPAEQQRYRRKDDSEAAPADDRIAELDEALADQPPQYQRDTVSAVLQAQGVPRDRAEMAADVFSKTEFSPGQFIVKTLQSFAKIDQTEEAGESPVRADPRLGGELLDTAEIAQEAKAQPREQAAEPVADDVPEGFAYDETRKLYRGEIRGNRIEIKRKGEAWVEANTDVELGKSLGEAVQVMRDMGGEDTGGKDIPFRLEGDTAKGRINGTDITLVKKGDVWVESESGIELGGTWQEAAGVMEAIASPARDEALAEAGRQYTSKDLRNARNWSAERQKDVAIWASRKLDPDGKDRPNEPRPARTEAERLVEDVAKSRGLEVLFYDWNTDANGLRGASMDVVPKVIRFEVGRDVDEAGRDMLLGTLGHEMTHSLARTDPGAYTALIKAIKELGPYSRGEHAGKRLLRLSGERYAGGEFSQESASAQYGREGIEEEGAAEISTQAFMDPEFWKGVRQRMDPKLWRRVATALRKALANLGKSMKAALRKHPVAQGTLEQTFPLVAKALFDADRGAVKPTAQKREGPRRIETKEAPAPDLAETFAKPKKAEPKPKPKKAEPEVTPAIPSDVPSDVLAEAMKNPARKLPALGHINWGHILAEAKAGDTNAVDAFMAAALPGIHAAAMKMSKGRGKAVYDTFFSDGYTTALEWLRGHRQRRPRGVTEAQFEASGGTDLSNLKAYKGAPSSVPGAMVLRAKSAMEKNKTFMETSEEGKQVYRKPQRSLDAPAGPGADVTYGDLTADEKAGHDRAEEATGEALSALHRIVHELVQRGAKNDAIAKAINKHIPGAEATADMVKEFRKERFATRSGQPPKGSKLRELYDRIVTQIPKLWGRPELANLSKDEAVRRYIDLVDKIREDQGLPAPATWADTRKQAKKLMATREGRSDIRKKVLDGELLTGAETLAAGDVVVDNIQGMLKTRTDRAFTDAFHFGMGWRRTGTEAGRSLAFRRDMAKDPKARTAEFLTKTLMTPPRKDVAKIDAAQDVVRDTESTPSQKADALAQIDKIAANWKEHADEILAALEDRGIDTSNLPDELPTSVLMAMVTEASKHKAGWSDKFLEFWHMSLLSGPQTHIANLTGNTLNLAVEAVELGIQATINEALRLAGHRGIKGAPLFTEIPTVAKGILPALNRASWYAEESFKSGHSMLELDILGVEGGTPKVGTRGPKIKSKLVAPLRAVSTASLTAEDAFYKGLSADLAARAIAFRQGYGDGLRGDKLGAFVEKQIGDYTSDSWLQAVDEAERLTYTEELGGLGKKIVAFRDYWQRAIPVPLLGGAYHMTFIHTLLNILKQGYRRTPLYAPKVMHDLLRGRLDPRWRRKTSYTGAKALRQISNQVMSLVFTLVLAKLVSPDDEEEKGPRITGSIPWKPQSRGERAASYRRGMGPYTIRIGEHSLSYGRLEPLAVSVGVIVDLLTAAKKAGNREEKARAFAEILSKSINQFEDKTFARGIANLVKAYEASKEERAEGIIRLFGDQAAAWMPNIVRGTLRASDDYIRDTRVPSKTWAEYAQGQWDRLSYQMVPIAKGAPPPKVDLWGREIKKEGGIIERAMSPLRRKHFKDVLPYDRMLRRWNAKHPDEPYYPEAPRRYVTYQSPVTKQQEKIVLTPEQYYRFSKTAGLSALAMIKQLDVDPKVPFSTGSPTQREIDMFKASMTFGRSYARKIFLATVLDEGGRLKGEINE